MEVNSEEVITEANARNLPATILNLKVVDTRTYELMANGVQLLRKAKKFFEDRAKPRIAEAFQHHKNLVADLDKDLNPIISARMYGDKQLADYDTQQRRIAQQKQLEAEAAQKKKDDEQKIQLAELAEKIGDKQLVEEILDAPNEAPPVVVQADVPKVAGLSYREDWKHEITDEKLLPREYLMPDFSKITKIVRALKNTTDIPGVRVYAVRVTVGRG